MTTKTIGNGTRDYTSIQAWDDAAPATLTEIWEGLLYKEGGGTDGEWQLSASSAFAVVIGGSTATSSYYKRLACASGQSFRDNASKNSNALRYNPANGVAVKLSGGSYGRLMQVNEAYAEVDGIQFWPQSGEGVYVSNGTLRNCIFYKPTSAAGTSGSFNYGNAQVVLDGNATTPARVINSLIVTAHQTSRAVKIGDSSGHYGIVESCTIIKPTDVTTGGDAVVRSYGTAILRNCLILGNWSNASSGTFDAASGYNGTDKGSVAGSNNQVSLTAANQVENLSSAATLDARLKSGNGVATAGNRQQTLTGDVDILNNARSTSTPAIGAISEITGGAGITLQQVERGRGVLRGLGRGL